MSAHNKQQIRGPTVTLHNDKLTDINQSILYSTSNTIEPGWIAKEQVWYPSLELVMEKVEIEAPTAKYGTKTTWDITYGHAPCHIALRIDRPGIYGKVIKNKKTKNSTNANNNKNSHYHVNTYDNKERDDEEEEEEEEACIVDVEKMDSNNNRRHLSRKSGYNANDYDEEEEEEEEDKSQYQIAYSDNLGRTIVPESYIHFDNQQPFTSYEAHGAEITSIFNKTNQSNSEQMMRYSDYPMEQGILKMLKDSARNDELLIRLPFPCCNGIKKTIPLWMKQSSKLKMMIHMEKIENCYVTSDPSFRPHLISNNKLLTSEDVHVTIILYTLRFQQAEIVAMRNIVEAAGFYRMLVTECNHKVFPVESIKSIMGSNKSFNTHKQTSHGVLAHSKLWGHKASSSPFLHSDDLSSNSDDSNTSRLSHPLIPNTNKNIPSSKITTTTTTTFANNNDTNDTKNKNNANNNNNSTNILSNKHLSNCLSYRDPRIRIFPLDTNGPVQAWAWMAQSTSHVFAHDIFTYGISDFSDPIQCYTIFEGEKRIRPVRSSKEARLLEPELFFNIATNKPIGIELNCPEFDNIKYAGYKWQGSEPIRIGLQYKENVGELYQHFIVWTWQVVQFENETIANAQGKDNNNNNSITRICKATRTL